ncbi:ABC-F family ATP-binding cassette domain-containing protein [Pelagicoccus sp. SDUM812002]|uniref:ABC-F family ATP-binding cassette domain-containing protein n=1 Tax=Pelagicoccus sp. SDUM812002 TaxID=3041266 RepID=UPI00280E212B|nr:ABC-F family ATP-binding cassette domain-containing protein [Pelagicoccus sp. SDUM812002]MDQ8186134.1 ABC-F family ATP-binding cassette domain-containing protein [Pelagicoccus sp. SDUM812002]
MITLRNITLQYGERYLFRDATASIGSKDRIGLVGANGAGKTTLLKIIAGGEPYDSGGIDKANYVSIGYLPQDGIAAHGKTLFDEVHTAFSNVIELKQKIEDANARLNELETASEEFAETLELLGEWEIQLEDLDVARIPSRIESILLGLGFRSSDMKRMTDEFSGGWQMRIALAKLLLAQPSLLLLDEPTNHLDVESQAWLEDFLRRYHGSLLVVSHDRAFLDSLITRTFEVYQGALTVYTGNYSKYEVQSVERRAQLEKAYLKQQRELAKTQQFIDRFRAKATKAKQVQSRIKALGKVDRIEIEQEADQVAFSFPEPPRSGQNVIEVKNLRKSYGDLQVIHSANIRIERGDKIAVVGVNGAGKTTLAKVLAGVESFQDGERIVGGNTSISYFAQHQADELDPELDIFETIERVAEVGNNTSLRTILGSFLFQGDDVFKKVKVLSGGERNRVALAKMLVQPANFLILDEPTNHLDIRSQDVLRGALEKFPGTFLIVSHNRDFLDSIVSKVLEVRKDGLSLHPGNVSDYLARMEAQRKNSVHVARNAGASAPPPSKFPTGTNSLNPKEQRRLRALQQAKLKPLTDKLKRVETEIARLESQQSEYESLMSDPDFYKDANKSQEILTTYDSNKRKIEAAYEDWSDLSDQVAAAE